MADYGKAAIKQLAAFRQKVNKKTPLLGTFVKTPSHHNIEILGQAGFDFVVLDLEHAPFNPSALDVAILAGRSVNLPVLVRVPEGNTALVSACLDLGAAGVVLPHIKEAEDARRAVAASKFFAGQRGLSPSPRVGGYGSIAFHELPELSDNAISVWAQIEDQSGLDNLAAIAAVEGIDALFVGPVDLANTLGVTSVGDTLVRQATEKIHAAAQAANLATVLFVNALTDAEAFADQGVSVFVMGTDQSFLRAQACTITAAFESLRQPDE
jgi:2-keto-3-deoxy-L-rhamnonate aldolase RhmA